jgi:S-adenosyl methyltransferase
LDLSQPVAILLLSTLAFIQDAAEAAAVVSSLAAAVPSGSHFAIWHLGSDLDPVPERRAGPGKGCCPRSPSRSAPARRSPT